MKRFVCLASLALLAACAPEARAPSPAPSEGEVTRVLDAFHDAAARSDEEAYFSLFAKDGVFLGTDATERWGVAAFRAYAHPHFAQKHGWVMRATSRHVSFTADGAAYFDEALETKNLGPARGSGVLVREGGTYKVLQYNLTVTVPNEQLPSVRRALAGETLPTKLGPAAVPPVFRDPGRGAAIVALGAPVTAIVEREMELSAPPSLAVAIVADGKIAHVVVRGEADKATHEKATPTTLYRVGSITKTFTATAALALRDAKKLALDDRADVHLAEMGKVTIAPADARAITLRQLLTHSSGLPRLGDFDYTRPDRDVPEAEVLKALETTSANAPGAAYLYSNFGMSLVGLVLARAERKPYREVIAARLLGPLGMTTATFEPTSSAKVAKGYERSDATTPAAPWRLGASEAAGGLYASLEDMAKWVAFHEEAWPPRDAPDSGPVRRASLRESHVQGVPSELDAERTGGGLRVSAEGVGLAWHVRRTCDFSHLVEHGGAIDGFHADVSFAPDRGIGIVVLSNSLAARTSRVAQQILDTIAEVPALRPRELPFAHEAAVEAWLAALGRPSKPVYEATFDEGFRAHVPAATLDTIGAQLAKRHGACKLDPRRTDATSPHEATLFATCERGALRMHALAATTAAFAGLSGFTVSSTGFPVPASVLGRARAGLALAKAWDETKAKALFGEDVPLARVRAGLASLFESHGPCTLGQGSGDGETSARFSLTCARGRTTDLTVELGKDSKIHTFLLAPAEGDHRVCR